jgi:Prokaryotic RING finger family 1
LTLLFLLVIVLALGLTILLREKSNFPLLMFDVFSDASIGLVVGLAARVVLHQRNWFIRGIASAALVIIGLLALGYFTDAKSGIVFPPFGFVSVNWLNQLHVPLKLPLLIESKQMNWAALIYVVIGIDISWITLRAWKRSAPDRTETAATPKTKMRRSALSPRVSALPHLSFPKTMFRNLNAKPKVRRKRTERPLISTSVISDSAQVARPRHWNPLHRKPQIQLAVYEEHRCPYCLEEVQRNDPRGVVECEVCHTLHHKDCWDITGACQVPHLNT